MSILINRNTKVMTQGITGKTGQFHTRTSRDYANGRDCYVAGVNPKKAGEDFEGIPIYASVREAKQATGATVSVIYVPPAGAADARPVRGSLRPDDQRQSPGPRRAYRCKLANEHDRKAASRAL
jgi:hypothetical protein